MNRTIAIFSLAAAVTSTALPAFGEAGSAFYANDFTARTSGETPSGRWMETAYVPGALARSVSSISSEGREPYNGATEYQDGWTMKTLSLTFAVGFGNSLISEE